MEQYIGKVRLDDQYDLCEKKEMNAEEKKILQILSQNNETEYNQIIAQEKNWAILHTLTHVRTNLIQWLPIKKEDKVLEIGAGLGSLTGILCDKAQAVTAFEIARNKALICAERWKEKDNLEISVGRYQELQETLTEKFDWILLTSDAFEKAGSQIEGENPYRELLKSLKTHLKPDGKMIVVCGNRLGLKYFAGCKDQVRKDYFSGIEGYEEGEDARMFSRPELLSVAEASGFTKVKCYYPYPDEKLPMSIYSDQYLPKVGELWDNRRNFDDERYVLFDETKAFDNIIKDGLFPVFSNAFMLICENDEASPQVDNNPSEEIIFTKYSNERGRRFSIRTDILEDQNQNRTARKVACYPEGEQHVSNILLWQDKLAAVYEGTPMTLNHCEAGTVGVNMEYLTGETLEEIIDRYLLEGKKEKAIAEFLGYLDVIREAGSKEAFVQTENFEKVFGEAVLPEGLRCSEVTDIDMVAGNAMVTEQGWIHMDYEWTFDFPIPVDYVIYRIIQNLIHGNVTRKEMEKAWLYKRAGLTDLEIAQYEKMETCFQQYITQNHVPLRLLYDEVSPGSISFAGEERRRREEAARNAAANTGIEIFVDRFEIAMTGIYVYGWAVSKSDRRVHFRLLDENNKELPLEDIQYLYRKDVVDNFKLSGKNSFAGFLLQCALPDLEATKNKTFTLVAYDGITEVPFVIPAAKLRFKQSKVGKKLMDLRGAKDIIQYIAPKEMGIISESQQYRVENQRFDTWRMANRLDEKELRREQQTKFAQEPLFTVFVMTKEDTKERKRTIESLKKQTYAHFEILCEEYENITWEKVKGQYVIFMEPGDVLTANALFSFAGKINEDPEIAVLYSDSDKVDWKEKTYFDPQFKQDYAYYTLQSGNYIGNSVCFSKELLQQVGTFNSKYQMAAVYDLLLRCADLTDRFVHISKILYHQNAPISRSAKERQELRKVWELGKTVLQDYYKRLGIEAEVSWAKQPLCYRVKWKVKEEPLVSIIIPNQDHIADLDLCLSSIKEKSTYDNIEVLVVENNSHDPLTFAYYEKMQKKYPWVRLITWEREFNYSAINNFAVQHAKGDYFIFLNNDTEVLTPDWIEEMLSTCQQKSVGVVGCRLYYPDGTLQHAGVILGLGGIAGHLFVKEPGQINGYMGKVCIRQNLSAVTAACMMSSREAFEKVGGFDEKLQVALNDVDFCLRCRKAGYHVIYDPDTELYHYESKSRGLDISPEKKARYDGEVAHFRERWQPLLDQGDPYYNVNLSRTTWNCSFRIPR